MGICKNCVYIGEKRDRLKGEDFFCLNKAYEVTDFVTGEKFPGSCRVNNSYGECLLFDDGTPKPEPEDTLPDDDPDAPDIPDEETTL